MRTLCSLWHDEAGFIVSAELVVVGSLMVVGLLAGMTCMQEAVIGEYQEVAGAISTLDQSYSFNGMHGCFQPGCCSFGSWTAGSAYPASRAAPAATFDCTLIPTPAFVPAPAVVPGVVAAPSAPAICPPAPVTAPVPGFPAETGHAGIVHAPACTTQACAPARCPCVDTNPSYPANNYNDYGYADPRPLRGPLVW